MFTGTPRYRPKTKYVVKADFPYEWYWQGKPLRKGYIRGEHIMPQPVGIAPRLRDPSPAARPTCARCGHEYEQSRPPTPSASGDTERNTHIVTLTAPRLAHVRYTAYIVKSITTYVSTLLFLFLVSSQLMLQPQPPAQDQPSNRSRDDRRFENYVSPNVTDETTSVSSVDMGPSDRGVEEVRNGHLIFAIPVELTE
ncbi:uncharacterized protein N7484_005855 [Penicillium longicatenatum]|uniref:uncharacterized protein n=1 Tax=Penicillium longicatenatum TaxID=1561947 RepID=UPI0025470A41|nr:uncharacterized protein N7484_005855 [Penicillium longicatenatum]KAJ5643348.1 hypothetical protein N7484_005855 [Penicillium longicatenatum]